MEVSYYPGCSSHSTGIEYDQSLRAVLSEMEIDLVEIDDWNCCGGAAAHSVNRLLGLALPGRNVAKAQERELPVLVPCPACFNAVRKAQYALEHDADTRTELEEAIGFTYRDGLEVKTPHQIILDSKESVEKRLKKSLAGLRVVSYYGCLLVRDPAVVQMGDYENPRFLEEIVTTFGAEALEWSSKTVCCGADLAMTHRDIAGDIVDDIAACALEAEADCIMVACGLCHVNLDMRQSGKKQPKIPIIYFSELLGIAMDLPGRKAWWGRHVVDPRPVLKARGVEA